MLFNDTCWSQQGYSVSCLTILFFWTCKSSFDISDHTWSGLSAWWSHMVTSIFFRGLCGYIWANVLRITVNGAILYVGGKGRKQQHISPNMYQYLRKLFHREKQIWRHYVSYLCMVRQDLTRQHLRCRWGWRSGYWGNYHQLQNLPGMSTLWYQCSAGLLWSLAQYYSAQAGYHMIPLEHAKERDYL